MIAMVAVSQWTDAVLRRYRTGIPDVCFAQGFPSVRMEVTILLFEKMDPIVLVTDSGDDVSYRQAAEHLISSGAADAVFRRAVILAFTHRLEGANALRLIDAFTRPPPPVRWDALGHPSDTQCCEIQALVQCTVSMIESGKGLATETAWPTSPRLIHLPDLLTYAVLRQAVPCGFGEVVRTLGAQAALQRLRSFCNTLKAACMVG